MASTEEANGVAGGADEMFPAVDVNEELNPGKNKDFKVDSVSSELQTKKERAEAEIKEKRDNIHTFKSAILISGIVVAVAGAIFAITKKLREKN